MGRCDLWDAKSEGALRELFGEGLNTREIGERVNKSRNAVMGKLFRMGLLRERPQGPRSGLETNGRHRPKPPAALADDARLGYSNRPAPGSSPKPLLELGPAECRYPISSDGDRYLFCAAPVTASSYCDFHFRICYSQAQEGDYPPSPKKLMTRF